MNIKKKQSFVKSLSFELLGILGTFKMAEHSYPSSPHSKPCSLSSFYIVQTSRYRGQHLCSKFAKIPHMGCARAFKVPTSSRGPPPPSGITLIAALKTLFSRITVISPHGHFAPSDFAPTKSHFAPYKSYFTPCKKSLNSVVNFLF